MPGRIYVYGGALAAAFLIGLLMVVVLLRTEPVPEPPSGAVAPLPAEQDGDGAPGGPEVPVPISPTGVLRVGDARTCITGVVLDPSGVPRGGVTVLLVPEGGDYGAASKEGGRTTRAALSQVGRRVREILASPWRLSTYRDGRFTFEGMDPGPWRVVALAAPFLPGISEVLDVIAQEPVTTEVFMREGLSIRGRVVDEEGLAVEKAAVRARWSLAASAASALPADMTPETFLTVALGAVPRDRETGAGGSFSFPGVSPGIYELFAVKDGFARSLPVTVEAGETDAEVVLQSGLRLRGVVRSADGKPVAGAEIVAALVDDRDQLRSATRAFLRPDRFLKKWGGETDQDGAFLLTAVREGTYGILIRREEFQPGIFLGIRVSPEKTAPLEFELQPGHVLEGVVVGGDKKPIGKTKVTLHTSFSAHDPRFPRFETVTDETGGRFRFTTLHPADYRLVIDREGFVPLERDVIPQREPIVLRLVPGGVLRGVVVTAEKKRVAAARVTVSFQKAGRIGQDADRGRSLRAQRPKTAKTNAEGRFTLRDLASGIGELRVEAEGFVYHQQEVAVAPGQSREVIIELTRAGLARGRVIDSSGRPIPGVRLRLERLLDRERGQSAARPGRRGHGQRFPTCAALSDEEGAWVLSLPAAGSGFSVRASHPDYLGQRSGLFSVENPTRDRRVGDIVLSPGGALVGTITGPTGEPLSGIRIGVRRSAGREGPSRLRARFSGGPVGTVSTEQGTWRVNALREAPYTVWVDRSGFAPYRADIDLGAGEEKVWHITLQEEACLRGLLVTSQGLPLGGAYVTAQGSGVSRHGYSDQDGAFLLGGLQAEQHYRIDVRAAGFLPFRERRIQAPHENLEFILVEPAAISGRVLSGESRKPIRPVRIRLRPVGDVSQHVPGQRFFDAADGFFEITGIPPGTYTLVAESVALPPAYLEGLTLAEGAVVSDLEILMDEGLTIRGVVLGPRKKPADGAQVRAIPQGGEKPAPRWDDQRGGPSFREQSVRKRARAAREDQYDFLRAGVAHVDGSGTFVLRGLRAGRYVVEARHENFTTERSAVVVLAADGEGRNLKVTLRRGLVLTASVVLPNGTKGSGVTVTLRGPDKQLMRRTNRGAEVRFQGLSPGTYTLRAHASRSTVSERVTVKLVEQDEAVKISSWR